MSIVERQTIEFQEDGAGEARVLEKTPSVEGLSANTVTADLVVRYRDTRDAELFGELVQRYTPMLKHYLLGIGGLDEHEREDLSQDIFIQAQRKIDQLREPRAFGQWLKSTARRMTINKGQRTKQPFAMEQDMLEAFSHEDLTPEAGILALQQERKLQIFSALKSMKPLDRKMLQQFYFGGMSLNDMAEKNRAPLGTIKRRLHTARNRLGILLTKKGIFDKTL